MQQLFFFIQKYKYFLYFLLLQIIAISFIINNNSFHKSKFISSANLITGSINNKTSSFSEYLNLKSENNLLAEENIALKNELQQLLLRIDTNNARINDSVILNQQYHFINGKVIANEYSKPNNFITINRGEQHQLTSEMAVVNSKGIIGIIDYTSNSYARIQSILNRNSKINAKFKKNNYFGTLDWDTKDYTIVQLKDIPRQAEYNIGDTIQFTSTKPYRIVVSGRIKHFISAFGEHVIGKEVEESLQKAVSETNVLIQEFTVAPQVMVNEGLPYHEWFI